MAKIILPKHLEAEIHKEKQNDHIKMLKEERLRLVTKLIEELSPVDGQLDKDDKGRVRVLEFCKRLQDKERHIVSTPLLTMKEMKQLIGIALLGYVPDFERKF